MAPGGRYRQVTYSSLEVIATSTSEADTDATCANEVCKCCGQPIKKKSKYVIISTPTKVNSFFDLEKPRRNQPQDLKKTHHWKHKNKPKF